MSKETEKEKKMFVGIMCNYAAELKIFLTALLFLCSLATLLQFLPSHLSLPPSDLHLCFSKLTSSLNPSPPSSLLPSPPPSSLLPSPPSSLLPSPPLPSSLLPSPPPSSLLPSPPLPSPSIKQDQIINGTIIKRAFNPFGSASYTFIHMSSYRGGLNTFSIIGLASKPLHLYGKPHFQCEWVPFGFNQTNITTIGFKFLPDWGYGRVYTVVVINCTFSQPIGSNAFGGKLILHASTAGGGDRDVDSIEKIEALVETQGSFNSLIFTSRPKYDYLYCGSSLYGNLSPQRVREWIAYHVRLFGSKSHFIIHDAGGVHRGVFEVLKPWMDKGYVTLQDIREQERFDGYYHNQFLVVNDCLHRYRFMTKWMFFFDVDEFIYVPSKSTIRSVLDSLSDYTQFTIEQMPMSNKLCLFVDAKNAVRKWGFEKLVYRDVKKVTRRDRKYAVQPRAVFATGVHMSQNLIGKTQHKTEGRIKYFHYHDTIAERHEPCRHFLNASKLTFEGSPYVLDTTLRSVAAKVKKFELKNIGSILQHIPQ